MVKKTIAEPMSWLGFNAEGQFGVIFEHPESGELYQNQEYYEFIAWLCN